MSRTLNTSYQYLRNFTRNQKQHIFLFGDNKGWILSTIAHQVSNGLSQQYGMSADVLTTPRFLQNHILHFINLHAYLAYLHRHVHPSNKVIVMWHHGDPNQDRKYQSYLDQLLALLPQIDLINTPCHFSKQVLINHGISDEQVIVTPNGIEPSIFHPPTQFERQTIRKRLGIPENAFCIGSFQKDGAGFEAGNEPKLEKGPDVFLETLSILRKTHDNLFVVLTAPARGYVKQGLHKLNIPFVHRIEDNAADVAQYYAALDAYFIASRLEGGPQALMESWASGVPVVSTSVGMVTDWMQNGSNGLLADVEDASALANKLSQLIDSSELGDQLSKQALLDVQQLHWNKVVEQYVEHIYQPLIT